MTPHNAGKTNQMNVSLTDRERQQTETLRTPIYEQTRELLLRLSPGRWLDFGCGNGSLLARNQDVGKGYGYDNDPVALNLAADRGLTVFGTWEDVPEVDLIAAIDVVEHMAAQDLLAWMKRWHQKLASGGWLLLGSSNPECLTVWCEFWHDPQHVRPYTQCCLSAMARSAGFEESQATFRRMLPRRPLELLGKVLRRLGLTPPHG